MTHIEMVEKLRERANISYADAKDALERAGWDLLDAMIMLEKEGKTKAQETESAPPVEVTYSTKSESGSAENAGANQKKQRQGVSFAELLGKLFRWLGKLIKLGNSNEFLVDRHEENILTLPVTVLVLLLIIGFWAVIPLLIIGLFFGYRYSFTGPNLGRKDINDAMDKASDVAENIKEEFNKGREGEAE